MSDVIRVRTKVVGFYHAMSRKVQCRTRFFDAPQSVGVDIFVLLNWFARFEIKALSLSLSQLRWT